MQLLVRCLENQFQRNHLQHVLAEELKMKIQKIRQCFTGNNLPVPTAKVAAAWHNLPNGTVDDVLPMSMRTDVVLAPPPTPTGFKFGNATSNAPSFDDSHDPGDDWALADTPRPRPRPEVATPRAISTTHNASDFIASWHTEINQVQSTDRDSASSSDPESSSSGTQPQLEPAGFHAAVDRWFLEYRAQGRDAFTTSVIEFGTRSPETATLAARIARVIIKIVSKTSYTEGKELEDNIRFKTLSSFQECWQLDDPFERVPPGERYSSGIASFTGSLFDLKICTPRDIQTCLLSLSEGGRRLDRLCAMHALLIQANDKLCKRRHLGMMMDFRQRITAMDARTGDYFWVTTPHARTVLNDILATIERWMASQTHKRNQPRTSSGKRTIRKRAAGPRLRNGPVVATEPLVS